MRRFVLFMIPLSLMIASDKAPSGKETKKPAPAAAAGLAKTGSISIPPEAVEIGPQVYRYKDADGKSWIYRKTPFGISKMEEITVGEAPAPLMSTPAGDSRIKVRAIDKGDSVRFEQQTPMGPRVWERKKSELTPQENAWLERSKTGSAPDSTKPEK